MANIPAPRGYFPPQTNLRVATPIVGQTGLPLNTNVQQPNPFFDMKPYQEFFGDPTRDLLASTRAAIASRTTQPLATPTSIAMPSAPLARSRVLQGQQGGVPLPQPRPEGMPPSGLDQLRAAQLRMPARGTPADAGLRAAAATGLQLSGYQDRPITMGQGLGAMLGAYTESEQAAADRQAAAQQQAISNQLAMMQLYQKAMPEPSKARQAAIDIGLDPDSPEGQQWMSEYLMKSSGVNITQQAPVIETEFDKQMGKLSVDKFVKMDTGISQLEFEIAPRLQIIENLLESGQVTTGAGTEFFQDVRRIADAIGMLPSDQQTKLSQTELLAKNIAYLVPRFRVEGSGSTSEGEIALFQKAIPSMEGTTQGNLMLTKGMRQLIEWQRKKTDAYGAYISSPETKGDMSGFEEHWNSQDIRPFYTLEGKTPEEASEMLNGLFEQGKIKKGDIFYDPFAQDSQGNVVGGYQIYG